MVNPKIVTLISAVIASVQPVAHLTFAQEPFYKGKTIRDYHCPYVLPPRKALHDTMKDQEFLAHAAKPRLDIDPVTGTELENLARGLFKLSPSMITKLKTILLPS